MRLKSILLSVSVLAALIAVKLIFLKPENPKGDAGKQPADKNVASVSGVVIRPQRFESKISSAGTVLANEEVVLVPEIAGKIIAINFKEGSRVSKGDLLVKINDADLQAQLKKQELQEKLAAENEAREKKLLEAKGISQMEYDAVLTQLNSAKSDVELTQAQIAKTEIRAPFSGTIGLKYVSEGSYVTPATLASSAVKIASLEQTDPVKIDFSIPEKYSTMVRKGDSIHFTVPGLNEKFSGVIYAMEPKIDLNTRTLPLRALCPNRNDKILPGAFAEIELILKENNGTILIPTEALIPELKGQKVFVSRGGKAQSEKVQTGTRTPTQIQITSGLQAGDTVITTGIMQLKDNTPLKIISLQ